MLHCFVLVVHVHPSCTIEIEFVKFGKVQILESSLWLK